MRNTCVGMVEVWGYPPDGLLVVLFEQWLMGAKRASKREVLRKVGIERRNDDTRKDGGGKL